MKIRILRQRNPAYREEMLAENRALYEGGEALKAVREKFLPQQDVEPDDCYKKRIAHAKYANHAGSICDVLAAFLFSEPPSLETPPSTWWTAWLNDVDRQGTSLAWWARDIFVEALIGQRAWCWVNLPKAPVEPYPDVKAQDAARGRDAILVTLAPELVIDWAHDENGSLAWVMVEDQVEHRDSVEASRTKVYRWRHIDAKQIRTWTWTPTETKLKPDPEDLATEQPTIEHGQGRLPVLELCLPAGLWAMGKLHDPAADHYRARNDLSWALNRAAHALLVIAAKDRHIPTLGAGYYLSVAPGDEVAYVEPSGACFKLLADDVTALREDMYRVVQQMASAADPSAQAAKQSGESKQSDWQAAEIVLSSYAELLIDWLRRVLAVVAELRDEDAEALVLSGLEGWHAEDLAAWLGQAALATDAHTMSPTFRRAIAKRSAQRLLADESPEVLAKIAKEIDASPDVDPAAYTPPPRGVTGGGKPNPRDPRAAGG